MSESLIDITTKAIASAALSLVLLLAFAIVRSDVTWRAVTAVRRPTTKKAHTGPRTRPLTVKISNIPGNITKEEFEGILANLADELGPLPNAANRPGLLGWSFARSGHSEQSSIATATFCVPPAPSQLEFAIKRSIGAVSDHLRVDLDFFGLTPLADPQDAVVDIIAVTGLAGHAFGSWKSRGGPCMWLRDFLPESIPNARILTYGYDTKLPGSQSTASILELSKKLLESVKTIRSQQAGRPLIFIGHSLGGLVVKQALVQAAEGSPEDQVVFRSCYADMFFGVPNMGLNISSLESMVKGQPNEDLVRNLSPSSSFLSLLHKMFYEKFTLEGSQIICIFETKETATVQRSSRTGAWERTGPKVMMVPQTSAIYAGKNEKSYDQLSIDADHSDIVKFSDPSNSDYVIIKSRIKKLVDHAPEVIKERIADHRKRLSDAETKYLKALNAPDYASKKDQVEDPANGTFEWFLRDEQVRTWLSRDESSLLWIRGGPGQGKTVLSKFLLDHLRTQPPDNHQHVRVIYFFFYDQDERFQTIDSLLRSLIKQLLTTTDYSGHIVEILELDPSTDSEETLWAILEDIIRCPVLDTIYCIIDALDECKDEGSRKRLLSQIKRLLQAPPRKGKNFPVLKLLITSRPIVDISRELGRFPCINLKANNDDLKIVINGKVEGLDHLSSDLQKVAAKLLLGRAERTFLWVSIVLKKLETLTFPSIDKLTRTIEESPTDLDKLYCGIIDQILEGDEDRQKLLAWVVYGRRPLTLKELEAALATHLDSRSEKATGKYKVNLTKDVINTVILEITDDSRVHLIHQSAKDFLLKNRQLTSAKFCTGLHPNIYLAKICIIYLSFEEFETGPCGDREKLIARTLQYPLYHYAAHNWHAHIQNKDDIDGISNILGRIIEPGSPILLSWGEAAEIQDLHEAVNTWGIATKANITWLAEFQSADTLIEEERVIEAAKNGWTGYNIIEMFVRRGDVRFTEEAVQALATHFNEWIMRLWLDRNDGMKITHTLIKAAASNRRSGSYVMRMLLELSDDVVLTAGLVEVAATNEESGRDIIELLLRKDNIQIADGVLVAIAKIFDSEVIKLLLGRIGDIEITEEVVKAAAMNSRSGEMVMSVLLDRQGHNFKITEGMVQVIATSFDNEVMTLLLNRQGDNFEITEALVQIIATSFDNKMMRVLFYRQGGNFEITEGMVQIIANSFDDKAMQPLLERHGDKFKITDGMLQIIAESFGKKVMTLLLNRQGGKFKITQGMVQIIAKSFDDKAMQPLLDRHGDKFKVTEEVIKAAAGNSIYGEEVMKLLLDRRGGEIRITEDVVKAAAGNRSVRVMKLLLDQRGSEIKITEEVVNTVLRNGSGRVMKLLLDQRGGEIKITEEVVKTAAGNRSSWVMKMFLDQRGSEIKITEEVVKAAAGNSMYGEEVMKLLLDRHGGEIEITEEVIKAAAGNNVCGEAVMKLFLDRRGGKIKIIEEAVKTAVRNRRKVTELLKTDVETGP